MSSAVKGAMAESSLRSMLTGGLIGTGIAAVLFIFEYFAVAGASRQRAKRRALKNAVLDQSEVARLRNLGWFCVQLPFICAAIGWLLA